MTIEFIYFFNKFYTLSKYRCIYYISIFAITLTILLANINTAIAMTQPRVKAPERAILTHSNTQLTAQKQLSEAARNGDSRAALALSKVDPEHDMKWLKLAAKEGNLKAQHALGVWYLTLSHAPDSVNKCLYWLKKSANNGYGRSALTLARLYAKNILSVGSIYHIHGNNQISIKWYKKAIATGSPRIRYVATKELRSLRDYSGNKKLLGKERTSHEKVGESSTGASSPRSEQQDRRKAATEVKRIVHRIKSGETLWGIARRYGVSVADLARWNGIPTHATLRPGEKLRVRVHRNAASSRQRTVYYTVEQGDTLWHIARLLQVHVQQLKNWNNLGRNNYIQAGEQLKVVPSDSTGGKDGDQANRKAAQQLRQKKLTGRRQTPPKERADQQNPVRMPGNRRR